MTYHEMYQQGLKKYFLHVTAIDPNTGDNVTIRAAFRVFGRQERVFFQYERFLFQYDQYWNNSNTTRGISGVH